MSSDTIYGHGWVVEGWHFLLYNVHCQCGRFLAKVEPVIQPHDQGFGIGGAEGECKQHGRVSAATWDICDVEPS